LKFNKIFFYTVFLAWAGLIIWNLAQPKKVFSENENRYLAEMPEFSFDKLVDGEYMDGIDAYVSDQFVLREQWIHMKTMLERAIFKQDVHSVYLAKDGYLIERHDYDDVPEKQAEENREHVAEFVKKYAEKYAEKHTEKYAGKYGKKTGIGSIKVMLVPTASEILADKLPPFATGYDQGAYMDRVSASLPEHSFLDLRDTFWMHRDEYIYYRTDHHWTTAGAYEAYVQWAEEAGIKPFGKEKFEIDLASDRFYGTIHAKLRVDVKPDDIYLYHVKEDMGYQQIYNLTDRSDSLCDYEKLEGKDKYAVFMGGNHGIVEIRTNQNNGRRLLVVKDSFANSFVPFAANHFEKTFMVDLRYYHAGIEALIEENEITDILVLYSTIGFAKDINIGKILK